MWGFSRSAFVTDLVPALHGGSKRATADEGILGSISAGFLGQSSVSYEYPWLIPLIAGLGIFHPQSGSFFWLQCKSILTKIVKGRLILSQVGAFPDVFVVNPINSGLFHEASDQIVHFLMRFADERIDEFLPGISGLVGAKQWDRLTLLILIDAASSLS